MSERTIVQGGLWLPHVKCPRHGEHPHVIQSTIPGYKGAWCQLCWLETLGEPLPVAEKPVGGER